MKIAVLGWGSLIWDKKSLIVQDEDWAIDGPKLPIEFARISKDGRLTLVIHPDSQAVQVLWNIMAYTDLTSAKENLKFREGSQLSGIGFVDLTNESNQNGDEGICKTIREWAYSKDLDAVIWTNLGANFQEKTGLDFAPENVLNYLKNLKEESKRITKEYIVKAPKQIRTEMRLYFEKNLGWRKESRFSWKKLMIKLGIGKT